MGWWSFDTYPDDDHTREARVLVQHWVDGTGFGDRDDPITAMALYIHGSVGVGKTGLAWAAMRRLIEQGLDADFRNVRDLLAGIRRSYSDPGAPDPLDGLATVSLLVLDDLGAERPTEWALETIASLIEERYQRELSTIVTTNYKPSELVKRLTPPKTSDTTIGQRIVSRLAEDCLQIHLDGPDRRLRNAA
jgi:DNA replication protein DnaC